MREDHRVDETDPACEPARRQKGDSGQDVDEEEEDRELAGVESPAHEEPVRHERLHDEAASEGVEPEERTELRDGAGRAMDTEETALAFDPRSLHLVGEAHEDKEIPQTDDGVEEKERTVRVRSDKTECHERGHDAREK